MAEAVQIDFVADTKKFDAPLKNSAKGVTEFTDKTNKAGQSLQKGQGFLTSFGDKTKQAGSSVLTFAKGMILANVIQAGFSKAMAAVPAIGQTFDALGSVIMNNLFKPLSDAVLPILVSIVRWVQENRAGFVKLGQVIANIFNAAVSIIKTAFGFIKGLFEKMIGGVFGTAKGAFSTFADFLNFLLLKIVFVITFMQILLEPVLESIANLFLSIYENGIKPFVSGFVEGINSVMGEGQGFMSLLVELADAFIELIDAVSSGLSGLAPVFSFLGKVFGILFGGFIKGIIMLIKFLANPKKAFMDLGKQIQESLSIFDPSKLIQGITNLAGNVKNALGSAWDFVKGKFTAFWDTIKTKFQTMVDWFKGIGKMIGDAIESGIEGVKAKFENSFIGKAFTKITGAEASPAPQVPSIASTQSGVVDNSKKTQVNNITINGASDPKETAKQLNGVMEKNSLRNQMNDSLVRQGAK